MKQTRSAVQYSAKERGPFSKETDSGYSSIVSSPEKVNGNSKFINTVPSEIEPVPGEAEGFTKEIANSIKEVTNSIKLIT